MCLFDCFNTGLVAVSIKIGSSCQRSSDSMLNSPESFCPMIDAVLFNIILHAAAPVWPQLISTAAVCC